MIDLRLVLLSATLVVAPGVGAIGLLLGQLFFRGAQLALGLRTPGGIVASLGAVLWGTALLLHEPRPASWQDGLQALLLPAIAVAVELAIRGLRSEPQRWRRVAAAVSAGILLGLLIMTAVSAWQWVGPEERVRGWLAHPNLWGAAALLPGLFLVTATELPRWRLLAIAPMLLIGLASGSRAALLGMLFGLLLAGGRHLTRYGLRRREAAVALIGLVALIGIGALTPMGDRFRGLADLYWRGATPETAVVNLFRASEELTDSLWFARNVTVTPVGAETPRSWRITALVPHPSTRLQQRLLLEPHSTYTLSAELRNWLPAAAPGLLAWYRDDATGTVHALTVRFDGKQWLGNGRGALALVSLDSRTLPDGWVRLEVALRNQSDHAVPFPIGPTPDQNGQLPGASVDVRKLQLERGLQATAYQPTYPPDRERLRAQSSALGRVGIFRAAWASIRQRPLLGWGPGAFVDAYQRVPGNEGVIVTHAHNLVLQALFERGIVGLSGLLLLLLGLVLLACRRAEFLLLLAAVLLANTFDLTFWTAGVSYLLAAAAGFFAGAGTAGDGQASVEY